MKIFKKIIGGLLGFLLLANTALAVGVQVNTPNYFVKNNININPLQSTYQLGSTSNRWAKMWTVDLDVSGVFTFGGAMGGNLDMDGYNLIMDTDGNTMFVNDRDVGINDNEIGVTIGGAADFLFQADVFTALSGSAFSLADDSTLRFGNTPIAPDALISWNTAQTVDGLFLGLSTGQNTFVIAEIGDVNFDFAHGAQTNPFLFIHSATQNTTQWLGLTHNQTNGIIQTGAGDLLFDISGGNLAPTTNGGSSLGISGGNTFANLYLASGGSIDWGGGDVIIANASNQISIGGALIHNFNQAAATTGNFAGFTFAGGAHTGLTASTEATDINFNLARTVQFATGALATQRAFRIQAPTYDFVAASTLTTAVTVDIGGAPVETGNATITNAIALRISSNATTAANTYGLHVTAPTGGTTANYAAFFSGLKDNTTIPATGGVVIADTTAFTTGVGGVLLFQGVYTGTSLTTAGAIHAAKTNATDGNFSFDLAFNTRVNGGNNTEKFRIGALGSNVFTQTINTTGSPTFMTFTAAAHTTLTNADLTDFYLNLGRSIQFTGAAGVTTINNYYGQRIIAPTITTAGAGAMTVTTASTLYLSGAPTTGAGGGGTTISNAYALFVDAGTSRFDGNIQMDIGAGTSQLTIDGSTGGCIMMQDTDDAGWTEVDALNGVLTASVDADGQCD